MATQKTSVTFQRENRLAKQDTVPKKSKVSGLCYECRGPGHHWRDCPERKPPSEAPGRNRAGQRATSSAVSSHETLEDRCQRLRQEWVNAEFLLLSQGYEGKANIDKVAGAIGVCITAQSVKALVDTGSSVTILSWEVFQAIGRKTKVPVSALFKSEVTLHDYSQRPILVGAMVDLEVEFNGTGARTEGAQPERNIFGSTGRGITL